MKHLTILGLAIALSASVTMLPASAQERTEAPAITGAGSTFAFPIISRWSKSYQRWVAGGGDIQIAGSGLDDAPSTPMLDYEPTGSLAGIMRAKDGAVDFGASDVPLSTEELKKLGLVQFPIVIGGIAAVVNIDGVGPGEIKFTGSVLSDIYLGKIQNWSDPAIKQLNPDLKLPDAKIAVIRRTDGSGTTFNFTNYLSRVSTQWRDSVGSDLLVKWPTGAGAKGNDGMARAVKQTSNSIGYIEYAQAVQARLSYAAIQNRAGQFIRPSPQSFQTAAAGAEWGKAGDFSLLIVDASREDAYPLAATVFVLMQKSIKPARARSTLRFFTWSFDKGAKDAAALGYVPLPQSLVTQVQQYWASNLKAGS